MGSITIAAKQTPDKSAMGSAPKAELWYSDTGSTPTVASKALYLREGNFATATGNIISSKHVWAHPKLGTIKAEKVQLKHELSCETCEFGKIYILPGHRQAKSSPHLKAPL